MTTTTTPKTRARHAAGHHPLTARAAARVLTLAAIATIVAASITVVAPGSTGAAPATAAFPAPGASAHATIEAPRSSSIMTSSASPLFIQNDAQLALAANRGNGTVENPFIIEGKSFMILNVYGNYLHVRNTRAHVIIGDCVFGSEGFVRFENCSNVAFTLNTCYNTVRFNNCTSIIVMENVFSHSKNLDLETWNKVLEVQSSNLVLVAGNKLDDGMYFSSCAGVHVTMNAFNTSKEYSIKVTWCQTVNVSLNNISSSWYTGIHIEQVMNVSIVGNVITGSDRYGVSLHDVTNASMRSNRVVGNRVHGVYVFRSTNVTISGNEIAHNYRYGLSIWQVTNTVVSGNKIYFNGHGCINPESYSEITFVDNECVNYPPWWVFLLGAGGIIAIIIAVKLKRRAAVPAAERARQKAREQEDLKERLALLNKDRGSKKP